MLFEAQMNINTGFVEIKTNKMYMLEEFEQEFMERIKVKMLKYGLKPNYAG